MVTQHFSGHLQVTAAAQFQVEADQVHHAVPGLFQLRAQVFIAEIAGNLNHAFGRIDRDRRQLFRADQAVRHTVLQSLLEKRPSVIKRDRGLWGGE